jgi:hypothetical protein
MQVSQQGTGPPRPRSARWNLAPCCGIPLTIDEPSGPSDTPRVGAPVFLFIYFTTLRIVSGRQSFGGCSPPSHRALSGGCPKPDRSARRTIDLPTVAWDLQ